jgi:hypothetical protein
MDNQLSKNNIGDIMNIKEYIGEYLPKKCGVHPSCGHTALMVFYEEQREKHAYSQNRFKNTRERAAMGMPYKPVNVKEYNKGLDVLELVILIHRQKKHLENNQPRIDELYESRVFDAVEKSVIAADWWSG